MNNDLLNAVKQIIEKEGEEILANARRVSGFLSDLATSVPKPQKNAFVKCLEYKAAQVLKDAPAPERASIRQKIAQRINEEEGLDLRLCNEALSLLTTVLFGVDEQEIEAEIRAKIEEEKRLKDEADAQKRVKAEAEAQARAKAEAEARARIEAQIRAEAAAQTVVKPVPPQPVQYTDPTRYHPKITYPNKIQLKGVSKVYDGGIRALDDISLSVGDKEFVALLGPSGCGKSTIMRLIAGIDDITRGEIYIDGEKMNDVPARDRNAAYIAEDYATADAGRSALSKALDFGRTKSVLERGALSYKMTAYENMAYDIKIRKVPKDEIDRRINDVAKLLEIKPLLDRLPRALSGGQKLRVALGRAVCRNPKVFLFDDLLVKLDRNFQINLRAELCALRLRLNATVIYATNFKEEADEMADRVIVMKAGKITDTYTP